MHRLLGRQLKKAFTGNPDDLSKEGFFPPCSQVNVEQLCKQVDEAYGEYDKARVMQDRAMQLMSEELTDLNRKISEEGKAKLKESETRFRLAVEGTNDGIWDWNIKSNEIWHSPRCYEMLGYHPEDLPDTSEVWNNLISDEDKKLVTDTIQDSIKNDKPYNLTVRFRHKDGGIRYILCRASIMTDDVGEPLRLIGTFTDLTEMIKMQTDLKLALEKAEKANLQSHAINLRLQRESALIKLLHEATIQVNMAKSDTEAMQICLNLICGFTWWPLAHIYLFNEDLENRDNSKLTPSKIWFNNDPETYKDLVEMTENFVFSMGQGLPGRVAVKEEPVWISDIDGSHPNHPRAHTLMNLGLKSALGFPVVAGDRLIAVMEFFADAGQAPDKQLSNTIISVGTQLGRAIERHQTESKLIEAKVEAERANQAKTEFLSNMTHEMRTPLHGVLSYAGMGSEKVSKDKITKDKMLHYFNSIRSSGNILLNLVNNLLDLAKLESGKMEFNFIKSDLKQTSAEVANEFEALLQESNLSLVTEAMPADPMMDFDVMRIKQVIRNLLSNARKFTEPGKQILIRTKDIIIKDEISGEEIPFMQFSVVDQGHGIPEGEHAKIFEKFTQSSKTKDGSGGTGLGLPICREIVQGHGGKIWAENNEFGGATFSFIIPKIQKSSSVTITLEHASQTVSNGVGHP